MTRRTPKEKFNRMLMTSGICLVSLAFGFFLLEYVSAMDKPPLGMIFNIITGCLFIAVAGIVLFMTIKSHYFPKKKKSKSRPVFLSDELIRQKDKANQD